MTRVVAGVARGRPLKVPPGGTRPTSDRAREALFSTLLSMRGPLDGERFLDLYAGSGALGIEALSRGASSAVFVDSYAEARATIVANLRATGLSDRAQVLGLAVEKVLEREPVGGQFDLVLVDPPYALGTIAATVDQLANSALVHDRTIVVVETGKWIRRRRAPQAALLEVQQAVTPERAR